MKKRDFAFLVPILLIALLLRASFFVGPGLNDDVDYIFSAREVSLGNIEPLRGGSINAIRSMVTVPIAAVFFLSGRADKFTSVAWPLLCSLGTIALTYFIALLAYSRKSAIISSLLLAFFPLDILFSTQIVPTTQVAFFATASMFLQFLSVGSEKRRGLFLFLSGVFGGLSYLANIMGVLVFLIHSAVFFLLFPPKAVRNGKSLGFLRAVFFNSSIALAGFAIVFCAEAAFMAAFAGNPLHRLNVIHETEIMISTNTGMEYYPRVLSSALSPNPGLDQGYLGINFFLFLVGLVFLLLAKAERHTVFFLLFFLLLFSYFQFGVMTATMKPIAKWVRYLVVFGPAFSLVCARFLDVLIRKKAILLVAILLGIFVFSVSQASILSENISSRISPLYSAARTVSGFPEKAVHSDELPRSFIIIESGFGRDVGFLSESMSKGKISGGDIVVLLGKPCSEYGFLSEISRHEGFLFYTEVCVAKKEAQLPIVPE